MQPNIIRRVKICMSSHQTINHNKNSKIDLRSQFHSSLIQLLNRKSLRHLISSAMATFLGRVSLQCKFHFSVQVYLICISKICFFFFCIPIRSNVHSIWMNHGDPGNPFDPCKRSLWFNSLMFLMYEAMLLINSIDCVYV